MTGSPVPCGLEVSDLEPAWIGGALARLTRLGLRDSLKRRGTHGWMHGIVERLRTSYSKYDRFALVVDVRGNGRTVRSTLVGNGQAHATALGAAAIAEAIDAGEVSAGVWLAEQVIAPESFLARIAKGGRVPVTEYS